jgi:hypothetical protein
VRGVSASYEQVPRCVHRLSPFVARLSKSCESIFTQEA